MLAYRESGDLAKKLIDQTLERHNIFAGTLTVHADRGAPMTSKAVAFFLAETRSDQDPQPALCLQ